jgi:hypothetical protein
VNDELEFNNVVKSRIAAQGKDIDLVNSAEKFLEAGLKTKYVYNINESINNQLIVTMCKKRLFKKGLAICQS